jgi:nicotinamidase-related amidase
MPVRLHALPQGIELDVGRGALVVVDMQNDFRHPEGCVTRAIHFLVQHLHGFVANAAGLARQLAIAPSHHSPTDLLPSRELA